MSTPADVHTLTGAYALNALPPEDREHFEGHLAECPSCAEEVAGFGEALAKLGSAAAEEPPPHLREQTLNAAKYIRQLPPEVAEGDSDELSRWRKIRQSRWWRRGGMAVAAAAVVAALVLGYQNVVISQQLDALQQTNDEYAAMSKVLSAPDAEVISDTTDKGGTATAAVSYKRDKALLMASGLPEPPGDHVYQAWVMEPEPRSAGLLPPARQDRTQVMAHDIDKGDKLGLTVEPSGGSSQPTTDPIAVVSL